MDFNLLIGVVALGFGIVTLSMHLVGKTDMFSKLGAMKEKFGAKTGTRIHLAAYSLLPIIFGAIILSSYF